MNVKELKLLLNNYSESASVLGTWEGIFSEIDEDNLYIAPNGIVVIDLDDNAYKDVILSGKLVPRT
ncbi:hypothetical protein KKF61_08270 [Patescibacteria group bacterium]|nr:hypothetical protein [Patescibacteria group bacterium]